MCLLALIGSTIGNAQSPLKASHEITIEGLSMMSNVVIVQLAPGTDVFSPERALPVGVRYAGRLLAPERTVLYSSSFRKSNSSLASLLKAEDALTRVVYVQFDGPVDPRRMAERLQKQAAISFAEPWYVAQTQAAPNDPMFNSQDALAVMGLSQAWDEELGVETKVIAISDNGTYQGHDDLVGNLWTNTSEIAGNGLDDDNNGFIDDHRGYNFTYLEDGTDPGNTTNNRNQGHGTRVAGISSATMNNSIGMAGVGGKCRFFPLKTAMTTGGGIIYGYQSLMYAADMGFSVVNASWGITKPPSVVDQAVIDYCLAKGITITASAGNHGNGLSGDGWNLLNFPSAYDGVLGVGETSTQDQITTSSGLGHNAGVVAPGKNAVSTEASGGYGTNNTGTSFAAPMAAGVAGLVRSKWPMLTPRQVNAHLRQTADNIDSKNPGYEAVLPRRLNAAQALRIEPMSQPSLRIESVTRTHTDGRPAVRYSDGDTLDFTYVLVNDLGSTQSLSISLLASISNGWNATIVSSNVQTSAIGSGQSRSVGVFRVAILRTAPLPLIFSLHCEDDGGYEDELLDYLYPSSRMSTMQNDALAYSVGDDGTFGFSSGLLTRQGIGFNWTRGYWLLSPSGMILSESNSKVVKGFDNLTNRSGFVAEKQFIEPNPESGVMVDENEPIGVRVHQRFTFPNETDAATVMSISLENRSASALTDLAAGYYFDWDVGNAGADNFTRLAPEALPTTFRELGAAQLFARAGVDAVVVCAVVSTEPSFESQAAGMMLWDMVDDQDGLTDSDVLQLLSSGTSIQTAVVGDACGVLGMRFPGELAPGARHSFMIVIGVGATASEASELVRRTILEPNSVIEVGGSTIRLYPNPAASSIVVEHSEFTSKIQIINATGQIVLQTNVAFGMQETVLDVSSLSAGSYTVASSSMSSVSTQRMVVVR